MCCQNIISQKSGPYSATNMSQKVKNNSNHLTCKRYLTVQDRTLSSLSFYVFVHMCG